MTGEQFRARLSILILRALLLLSLALVVFCAMEMMKSGNPAAAVGNGFFMLGALYFFGWMFSFNYSGKMAVGVVDFLLYPRRYLKTPPMLLSPIHGLIAAEKYTEAETRLLELRGEHPDSPELTELLTELYAGICGRDADALEILEDYFKNRRFRRNELNLRLLCRAAELAYRAGTPERAQRLLKNEVRAPGYNARERQVIRRRLER